MNFLVMLEKWNIRFGSQILFKKKNFFYCDLFWSIEPLKRQRLFLVINLRIVFHSDESNILGHFYNGLYVAAAVVATKLKKI